MSGKVESHPGQDSQAFIVRIWRSEADGQWCFSVQAVATGERRGFAGLEDFLAYFRRQVDTAADNPRGPPGRIDGD